MVGVELGNELGDNDGSEDGEIIGAELGICERVGVADGRAVGIELIEGAAVGYLDVVGAMVGALVLRPSCVSTTGSILDNLEKQGTSSLIPSLMTKDWYCPILASILRGSKISSIGGVSSSTAIAYRIFAS